MKLVSSFAPLIRRTRDYQHRRCAFASWQDKKISKDKSEEDGKQQSESRKRAEEGQGQGQGQGQASGRESTASGNTFHRNESCPIVCFGPSAPGGQDPDEARTLVQLRGDAPPPWFPGKGQRREMCFNCRSGPTAHCTW